MRTQYSHRPLLVIATLTCIAGSLPAQEKPRFEGFRGTQRQTVAPRTRPAQPAPDRAIQQAERDWKQTARSIEEQSDRLADLSFDAFRSGLMPLPDHLAQLKLAESAEQLLVRNDDDAVRFFDKRVERLQRVVTILQGVSRVQMWQSEILLARALLAEARAQAAAAAGKDQLAQTEYNNALDLAELHLAQRRRESVVGFREGTITRFANGEIVNDNRFGGWNFFVYAPEAYTELPADEFLADAVSLLRSWRPQFPNQPGSADAYIAQYQIGRFHLRQALAAGEGDYEAAWRDADEAVRQLFALQVDLYRDGTALLFDVAIAWSLRDELADILVQHDHAVPHEAEDEMQSDLGTLTQFARNVADRRGRLQADLAYIDLLNTRQQARKLLATLQTQPPTPAP